MKYFDNVIRYEQAKQVVDDFEKDFERVEARALPRSPSTPQVALHTPFAPCSTGN